MHTDITVTQLVNQYDFNQEELYDVYEHVQSDHVLGSLLELCISAPDPHESLSRLAKRLQETDEDWTRLGEYFTTDKQPNIYDSESEVPMCSGEVRTNYDPKRIAWFNYNSQYE